MPGLDPDLLDLASRHLRDCSDALDDAEVSIRTAMLLSSLGGNALGELDEIDYEVSTLAEILARRSQLAAGFNLHQVSTSTGLHDELWQHLLEPGNERASVVGDRALRLIKASFASIDTSGNARLSESELIEAAAHHHDIEVRASAKHLLDNDYLYITYGRSFSPFDPDTHDELLIHAGVLGVDTAEYVQDHLLLEGAGPDADMVTITVEDLDTFLAGNAELASLLPQAVNALHSCGVGEELTFELQGWTANAEQIIAEAINRGVHSEDGVAAKAFVLSLPLPTGDLPLIPISLIHGKALEQLHRSAVMFEQPGDLVSLSIILSHLPESNDGYRNSQINRSYAILAQTIDRILNGSAAGNPEHPDYLGANWAAFGTSASFSVGPTIRGEQKSYFATVPEIVQQFFAVGNQRIFASIAPQLARFGALFATGDPTGAMATEFLNGFGHGERELQLGFAAMLGATMTEDLGEARRLIAIANGFLGIHEQAIINNDLNLDKMPLYARAGGRLATTVMGLLKQPIPFVEGESRSAGEIATDDGFLLMPTSVDEFGNFEGTEIPIGQPLPSQPGIHPDLASLDLSGEHNPINLDLSDLGLGDWVDDVSQPSSALDGTGLSTDYNDWLTNDGDITVADWTVFDDRMKFIVALFIANQFSSDLFESLDFIVANTPDPSEDSLAD